jgi:hypothetical protein
MPDQMYPTSTSFLFPEQHSGCGCRRRPFDFLLCVSDKGLAARVTAAVDLMARSRCGRVLLALVAMLALACAAAESTQMRGPEALAEADAALEKAVDTNQDGDAVEEAVDDTLSAALSGCGVCQQTGYCDHAFRNTPGQFCLAMSNGAPCCCPLGSQCAASPFDCRCRRVASYANPDSGHSTGSSFGTSFSTVLFILLVLCCICCCWLPAHKRHREREETIHYAQPVHVDTHYGTGQQPAYGYPGYPTAPAYEADNRGGGGGNSLAAGAAGAIGGLGVGAVLGSMLGGRGGGGSGPSYSSSSYFAGDTGGSSGFFGGDSGGYGGNVSQSTYTFSGDTGGGGGGGDDDTFSGDS